MALSKILLCFSQRASPVLKISSPLAAVGPTTVRQPLLAAAATVEAAAAAIPARATHFQAKFTRMPAAKEAAAVHSRGCRGPVCATCFFSQNLLACTVQLEFSQQLRRVSGSSALYQTCHFLPTTYGHRPWSSTGCSGVRLRSETDAQSRRLQEENEQRHSESTAPLPVAAVTAAAVAGLALFVYRDIVSEGQEGEEVGAHGCWNFSAASSLRTQVLLHGNAAGPVAAAGRRSLHCAASAQQEEEATGRRSPVAPAQCAASREGREVRLGNVGDFERGCLYELKIDEAGKEKVLLAHLGSGEFYCVGGTCTHFAAPLIKGILTAEDRVVCPWHDAEFDVKTGKCLNGPAMDGLPSFPVSVREGQVYAFLPNETLPLKKSPVYTQRASGGDGDQTFVIVGGGSAGAAAVETLRAEGFSGRLILISQEQYPPYDRTILSKNFLAKPDNLLLRAQQFLERELGVELWLSSHLEDIDFAKKIVSLRVRTPRGSAEEKTVKFDKLLLCTGSAPRSLSHLPNGSAKGIFTLRSLDDHQKLQQLLDETCQLNSQPRVVVIGSSFIGTETAAAFKRRGFQHVTLLGKESVPLERVLGTRVGEGIKQLITSKGVKYLPKTNVKGFTASDGRVTGVELDNGDILQADLVMVGIGGDPCTQSFKKRLVPSGTKAGVAVDPLLRVIGLSDVFAAGDIASYPYIKTGEPIRVEHWSVAMQQGRVAAANMLDQYKPFTQIPFFWSSVFGKSIRFAGFVSPGADEVIVEGDLEKQRFVAYYVQNDRVVAVCTMNRDPVAVAAIDLLSKNLMPSPGELRQGFKNSNDLLAVVHAEAAKSKKRLVN